MKNSALNKEQLILEAAEIEFMKNGLQGTKTVSIAKAAGVTHAMLHYYYRTKENLFNKVFEAKIELISKTIIDSFSTPNLHVLDRIKLVIESHFNFLAENPDLPRFIINELISQPERQLIYKHKIEGVINVVVPTLQNELDREAEKGNIANVDAFDLIIDIVSMNVFIFIPLPILKSFDILPYKTEDFLERRKRENIEVIMRRLKR